MSGISVNIKGGKELERALDKYVKKNGTSDIEKSLDLHALLIESDAKRKVAVDTGRLRSSITVETPFTKGERTIGTNTIYAKFIEFGTRFQKARPYLFPAYEINRKKFIADLKKILNRV